MVDVPLLDLREQIDFLKDLGVEFVQISEEASKEYLKKNNNLYELMKYCSNYEKHKEGKNIGKYIHLDFMCLIDLLEIDQMLRHILLKMCLDLEVWLKRDITRLCREHHEDGFQVVQEYIHYLDSKSYDILCKELNNSLKDLDVSLSEFLDVAMFGRINGLYLYLSRKYNDEDVKKSHYMMRVCKNIRNMCAHNEVLFKNMLENNSNCNSPRIVNNALAKINEVSKLTRVKKMNNQIVRDLVIVFYLYSHIINGKERDDIRDCLKEFKIKINRNIKFHLKNESLISIFDFLGNVIDNWYDIN